MNEVKDDKFITDLESVCWKDFRILNDISVIRKLFRRPKSLKDLLQDLYETRDSQETLVNIFEFLFDEGERAEASIVVIPFLGRLLPLVSDSLKPLLIDALVSLGVSYEEECLGVRGVKGSPFYDEGCYSTVAVEASKIVPFLSHFDPDIRMMACCGVAWFPELRETTVGELRKLSNSDSEDEQVVALVARALLRDQVELINAGPNRIVFASNIANCEHGGIRNEHVEIFLRMCDSQSDFGCAPFSFYLLHYAAELLNRSPKWAMEQFLTKAKPSHFLDFVIRLGRLEKSFVEGFGIRADHLYF